MYNTNRQKLQYSYNTDVLTNSHGLAGGVIYKALQGPWQGKPDGTSLAGGSSLLHLSLYIYLSHQPYELQGKQQLLSASGTNLYC